MEADKHGDERPLLEYVKTRLRMGDAVIVAGDMNEDFKGVRQRVGTGLTTMGLTRIGSQGTTRGIRKEERENAKANQAIWVSAAFSRGNIEVLTNLGEEWSDYHIPVQFTCEVDDERMGGRPVSVTAHAGTLYLEDGSLDKTLTQKMAQCTTVESLMAFFAQLPRRERERTEEAEPAGAGRHRGARARKRERFERAEGTDGN
jgi:hypothetical protein